MWNTERELRVTRSKVTSINTKKWWMKASGCLLDVFARFSSLIPRNFNHGRSYSSLVTRHSLLPLHTNHGFTLLEVMVALAILATAFAAALRLHSDSMGVLISARIHTKAAELAQFKLTEIEITGFKDVGLISGDFGDMAPDYVWDLQVEDTPAELWKKITVRVVNKHGGRAGEFELTEYMPDKALLATFQRPKEE